MAPVLLEDLDDVDVAVEEVGEEVDEEVDEEVEEGFEVVTSPFTIKEP